ncbi:MAG: cytochrome P450, partial [Moraxellaceae bacterium]|nr:cytochrome P450 [Moraxellaceae bacterium]
MSTKSSAIDAVQTKVINATSKVVPMHLQIQALKMVMKAKKKIIGRQRPLLNFVETPVPDVNTLALEDIDVSNPFLYRQDQWRAYFKRL